MLVRLRLSFLLQLLFLILSTGVLAVESSSSGRLMLLGDSITEGKFADDGIGFRKELYLKLKAAGLEMSFVGSYGESPCEGHFQSGRKISDFYPRSLGNGGTGIMDVTYDMDVFRPTMVSIHLGTNDLNSEDGTPVAPYSEGNGFAATQAGQMGTLIDYLLRWRNGQKGSDLQAVLVSLIIPIKYQDSLVAEFNIEVNRLVHDFQNGLITGSPEPVFLCDQYSRFLEHPYIWSKTWQDIMFDKLHPNTTGHQLMAQVYYDAISTILTGKQNWFTEGTWDAGLYGLDGYFHSQGIALADLTGDNREEIYVTRSAADSPQAREALYTSSDTLPYEEDAVGSGVEDSGNSRGAVFVDIDNDGDFDLFNGNSPGRNRLYQNLGDGKFQDITETAGIDNLDFLTTAVLALDIENDGDMDLYAVNSRTVNELYVNDGSGRFERQDRGANDADEPDIPSMSASAADFDHDGDTDIYVVKRDAANKLFINDGTGHFSDQAQQAGVALSRRSNGAVWTDLDGDARLDLLVSVSSSSADPSPLLRVFRNRGDGTFEDVSQTVNIPMDGYSALAADFDNDGDLDIITTNEKDHGAFFRNDGPWSFTQVKGTGSEIFAGDVRAAAAFDFDNDGDQDFLAARSDVFNVFMQNNLANGNHYLKINAFGPKGDIGGFGAKLWLYQAGHLGDPHSLLGFREIISASGHLAQNSPTVHFGLGANASCDLLAEFTDGSWLAVRQVSGNQTITIRPFQPTEENMQPAMITATSGDNQSARVNNPLPDPLIVQVLDRDGRPTPGAFVEFAVVAGEAQLVLPDSADHSIWLEAESGRTSKNTRAVFDSSSSHGLFVMAMDSAAATGHDTLSMTIVSSGQYIAWLRLINAVDSALVSISFDGGAGLIFPIPQTTSWQWVRMNEGGGSPTLTTLSTGNHELSVAFHSGSLQVDKVLLTTDSTYTPQGLGEDENESPNLSDRDGLVRRYVQLGTMAGPVIIEARLAGTDSTSNTSTVLFHARALPGLAKLIEKTSGDRQSGEVGVPLAEPFVVTVRDSFANPVPGKLVDFQVISGGGRLEPGGTIWSDSTGQAQVRLIPGDLATLQQVAVSADSVPNSPLVFTVSVPNIAAQLVCLGGNLQVDTVGNVLPEPIQLQVQTERGSPVEKYPVRISVYAGNGSFETFSEMVNNPSEQRPSSNSIATKTSSLADSVLEFLTDSLGMVQVRWRLGTESGAQQLKIDAGELDGSPFIVEATALPGRPAEILDMGGNGQTATVGAILPAPLQIKIHDRFENAVPNVLTHFSIMEGNGAFQSPDTCRTDSLGFAAARYRLGRKSGRNLIQATADGLEESIIFSVFAQPGAVKRVAVVGGNNQSGVAGHLLANPIAAKVVDEYDNALAGLPLRFAPESKQARIVPIDESTTDSTGIARAHWILGMEPGEQHAYAFHADVGDSAYFTAFALPNNPPQLLLPDSLTVKENELLSFIVSAVEPENDSIYFGAYNLPYGAGFDSAATREFIWTPDYRQAGSYYPVFTVRDHLGAAQQKAVCIRVENVNRPPVIVEHFPAESHLGAIRQPAQFVFSVLATDEDQDELHYFWLVNDQQASRLSSFLFQSSLLETGETEISAFVHDAEDTTAFSWQLHIVSQVELKFFVGAYHPYRGVALEWETGSSANLLGFNILRSSSQSGPLVNTGLFVPAAAQGRYKITDATAEGNVAYSYQLEAVQRDGTKYPVGQIEITVPLPIQLALQQNYPNPFNTTTTIRFELPQASHVILEIYDLLGRRVKSLIDGDRKPGYHTCQWDGRTEDGIAVTSGIYYYVLSAGQMKVKRKLAVIR